MELHDFTFFTLETLVIQLVMLWIILWVLNKFIFRPYIKYLDKESEKREKLEKDYKNIDKLIAEAEDKKKFLIKEAKEKSTSIISDAEDLWNKKRGAIIDKAEKDAKSIIESSHSEIEKERLTMLNWVKSKLIDLILKFNSKLFDDEKISKSYLEKELSSLK